MMSGPPPKSALVTLLDEGIAAYPTDANFQILDYFLRSKAASNNGDDTFTLSREKRNFSEAWSSSVLKSQAFAGRKSDTSSQMNKLGSTFVEDFIQEVSRQSKDISKLSDLSQKLTKTESAVDLVASGSRSVMLTLGAELLAASEDAFGNVVESDNYGDGLEGFNNDDYALMLARHAFKGAKKTWPTKKSKVSGDTHGFVPFSHAFVPFTDLVHGFMDLKQPTLAHSARASAGATPASLSIVGAKVASTQPSGQIRGWSVYGFLTAASVIPASRSPLNIFPFPIAVDRIASGDLMFVFESHAVGPILSLLGPSFARSLRQHPVLLNAWCRQFAAAVAACSLRGVTFAHNLQLCDLHVRDHGLLSLLNLSVARDTGSATAPSRESQGRASMVAFVAHALTVMLALSRRHDAHMKHRTVAAGPTQERSQSSGEGSDSVLLDAATPGDEEVVTITQGCTLDIAFDSAAGCGFQRQQRKLVLRRDAPASDDDDEDVVYVDVVDDPGTASLEIDLRSGMLRITALKPGHVLLSASTVEVYPISQALTSPNPQQQQQRQRPRSKSPTRDGRGRSRSPSSREGSGKGSSTAAAASVLSMRKSKASCILRVVVIPAESVRSLPLIELITLLESSRVANKPLFMNARCLRPHGMDGDSFVEDDELRVYKEWTSLKKALVSES
jgi:hypothetical protein